MKPHLERALGLFPATALVIGSVIGSGIFVSSSGMARGLPSGSQLIAVWIFAGVMTVLGALTQAELCSRMPVTGGLYSYFRTVFGDRLAFFYGWANFMIAGSGAAAAIAFIFAGYLGEFIPLWHAPQEWQKWAVQIPYLGTLYPGADLGEKLVAAVLILFLTALNVRGVRLGAWVQSLSVSAKILAILILVFCAFVFGEGSWTQVVSPNPAVSVESIWSYAGLWLVAMGGAFWSYDGWGNAAYVGGEIRDAKKNLPRAILMGITIVMAIYLLVNLAYLYVLSATGVASAPGDRVASSLMNAVVGSQGAMLIAGLVVLSTFDTVNCSVLTNARVYFAMANEGLFWKPVGVVHPKYHTPSRSLWLQGGWASILVVTGSFDLITSMYVFVNWLFYFLIPVALLILRERDRRNPNLSNQKEIFQTPFYPVLPLLFAAFTLTYVVYTLIADIQGFRAGTQPCIRSLMGLLLVLGGAPVLWAVRRRATSTSPA